MPSEIYTVCNSWVYTIIGAPAVTVRLALPKSDIVEKNMLKNTPMEKQACDSLLPLPKVRSQRS